MSIQHTKIDTQNLVDECVHTANKCPKRRVTERSGKCMEEELLNR